MATRWDQLIDVPDEQDTFVLKLTSGLDQRRGTVENYVVTESLKERFGRALRMLKDGLAIGRSGQTKSVGAFLHGSFGSGKSHFMAILSLLLQGYPKAREMSGLTEVVVENDWMDDVELLMIPFHMLGATSMESAVLGGYVDHVREEHPGADLPGVYVADRVLENARDLREKMGDEAFFAAINEGGSGASDGGWGAMDETWTAETWSEAVAAPAGDPQKTNLVGDVVQHLLPAMHDSSKAGGRGFVEFDEGLSIISRHAKELGKDGIILFLDELILWLSQMAAQSDFVNRELQKVPKLVEAQHSDRPAPIFSFVARQRDLSEMIGEAISGEDQTRIDLSAEWGQGRFKVIELEDRNLPAIAQERLLKPRNEDAREQIQQSFDRTMSSLSDPQRHIMETSQHGREEFRRIYPFSPALMQSLIVLSNELQHERSALKVMQLLLQRHAGDLELGDIIPVGDLWPVLAEGDEPYDPVKKKLRRTAKHLHEYKVIPVLEREHEVDGEALKGGLDLEGMVPAEAKRYEDFRDDARILQTLLLAAIVPNLEVFENMTPDRLLALNHGTMQAPIPGAERDQLVKKLVDWTTEISELHMTDPPDQTVELRLEGVDIEPLLEKAQSNDSPGTRRRKIKDLLYEWMGLEEGRTLRTTYGLEWRGDERKVEIAYHNIRKRPLQKLQSDGERWLVIVDYPFDEDENYFPQDDLRQLEEFEHNFPEGTETVAWLPTFLSGEGERLVGRLVRIDTVLNQFDQFASDLRETDRAIARRQLQSNRDAIRQRLHNALHTAYALSRDSADLLDTDHDIDEHLVSLAPNHRPSLPHGATFPDALESIVKQALVHKYSHAPNLPDERLRPKQVREMHEAIRGAIDSEQNSHYVDDRRLRRRLRDYAEKLDLGEMGDNRFAADRHWRNKIEKELQPGDDPIEVGAIYDLIDPPDEPTGLSDELKDLIVLTYADMEDMLVERRGQAVELDPGQVRGSDKLVRRRMPSDEAWDAARDIAKGVFGLDPPKMKNARSVQRLAEKLGEAADPKASAARQIRDEIFSVAKNYLGLDTDEIKETERYRIADKMRSLMNAFDEAEDATDLFDGIAALELEGDDIPAVRKSFDNAAQNLSLLGNVNWAKSFAILEEKVREGTAETGGEGLLEEARDLIGASEHAQLLSKFKALQNRVFDWLIDDETPLRSPSDFHADTSMTLEVSDVISGTTRWIEEQLGEFEGDELEISIDLHGEENE